MPPRAVGRMVRSVSPKEREISSRLTERQRMSTTEMPLGHIGRDDPDHPEHPEYKHDHEHDDPHRKYVVLIVFAPNDPEAKLFRFDRDTLVGEAAREAAAKFDYDE